MLVVLVGLPGAGKGTQAKRLAEHLGIPHCSMGDMFRDACEMQTDIGREASEYMNSGRLVPDPLVEQLVVQRLVEDDCRQGCVLDGFPRTTAQAEEFAHWAAEHYQPISVVVAIEVDEETLLNRLADRGRQDDNHEIVRERFRQFETLTRPLLEYYRSRGVLSTVDGLGDMDEVFQRILQAIEEKKS